MKQLLFILIFISTIAITIESCTSSEKIEESVSKNSTTTTTTTTTTTNCDTNGTIKDFTKKLAGCKLLIELNDGTRLLPVEYAVDMPELKDEQKISFSYDKVDAMTNCMAGETVKITCITILD